eukprot:scaffold64182_cov33-Tisochrysis_lutea.AAC.1
MPLREHARESKFRVASKREKTTACRKGTRGSCKVPSPRMRTLAHFHRRSDRGHSTNHVRQPITPRECCYTLDSCKDAPLSEAWWRRESNSLTAMSTREPSAPWIGTDDMNGIRGA